MGAGTLRRRRYGPKMAAAGRGEEKRRRGRRFDPLGRLAARVDARLVRHTGRSWVSRRATQARGLQYVPTLLLRTTSPRTGRRDVALFYGRQSDDYLVVGSRGGHPREPQWARNLRAEPRAVIWVDRRRVPVHARLLEGEERERAWQLMAELWPPYERYRERAQAHREIPVFALVPDVVRGAG